MERKVNWHDAIQRHNTSGEAKVKDASIVSLRMLKAILKNLKLGLSAEEIELIVNSFEVDVVNSQIIDKKLAEASRRVDDISKERNLQLQSLAYAIQEALNREHVALERVFFDFDSDQRGSLRLNEFSQMLHFLKINSNKQQVKLLFDAID